MTEVSSFSQEQQKQQQNVVTAPHPPRRPRVREVSSRFMSPMVSTSSSSSGDLHLPASAKCPLPKHSGEFQSKHHHQNHSHNNQNQQRSSSAQRRQQETEPLSSADENRLDVMRNLDTPHSKLVISTQQRKPQRSLKLFKENNGGGGGEDTVNLRASVNGKLPGRSTVVRSRSDTPIVHGNDRINPRSAISTQNSHRSNTSMVSAAAKLVQSQVSSSVSSDNEDNKFSETLPESSASSDCSESGSCCSSPMIIQKSKIRSFPECRSSMPEADQLPTISNRLLTNRGNSGIGDSSKIGLSPIYRSLSFEQPLTSPSKTLYRTTTGFAKPHQSSAKPPGSVVSLPPHPSTTVAWADTKKGRKILSQQENVHSLKMLHNRYLQWRFANARAAISVNAQTTAAEQSLYGLASQVSEMRDSIKAKRADFENLKRREALSAILEAQIPHLDEWSALEGDYLNSLVGAIKALQDASLRLPLGGNVRADLKELDGALNSASNMMESISSNFEGFVPKAEQMDSLVSELAAVASEERALIEECGDLLSYTQNLQVEECSLRGQLMQLKKYSSLNQAKEE